MELALKKEKYNRFEPIWHESVSDEFTADCVILDTMPDVQDILDAEGTLLLRSKVTEDGSVLLTASVQGAVLYLPEGAAGAQSLAVSLPVEMRLEGQSIQADCRTVCRMRLRSIEAKMVNSRKIGVRAEVVADVWCYNESPLELPVGMEQDKAFVHTREKTATVVQVSDVREKSFVITDQYILPSALSAKGRILLQCAEPAAEDIKFVSGKVIFRGRVAVNMLLENTETGQLIPMRYDTEFSQIMEADVYGEEADPEILLQLTGVYFDLPEHEDGGGKINVEVHMAAQCVCRKNEPVRYVEDMYSNREMLRPLFAEMSCIGNLQPVSMRQTVTGRVEFSGDGDAIWSTATIASLALDEETVKTSVNVRLVVQQKNGMLLPVRCRLGAEFTTEAVPGTKLENVMVRVTDVFCSMSEGAADIRVVLQMDGSRVWLEELRCVRAVEMEPDLLVEKHASLTLVRVGSEPDLWALAKEYHSSPEVIAAANERNTSGVLLIPKSR